MKRFSFLLIFALVAMMGWAEDMILLTNGATIRAKVIACSSAEVQYINLDIPNGPIFTLFNREIALVELNNGQTHYYSPMNFELQRLSHDQIFRFTPRNYYHEGKFYHRTQMEEMLRNTCDAAYRTYKKGKTLNVVGWSLLAGGIVLDGVGIGLMACDLYDAGIAVLCVGGATTIASIPTLLIGQYKINNAYKKYNKRELALGVGVKGTGVGVTLCF